MIFRRDSPIGPKPTSVLEKRLTKARCRLLPLRSRAVAPGDDWGAAPYRERNLSRPGPIRHHDAMPSLQGLTVAWELFCLEPPWMCFGEQMIERLQGRPVHRSSEGLTQAGFARRDGSPLPASIFLPERFAHTTLFPSFVAPCLQPMRVSSCTFRLGFSYHAEEQVTPWFMRVHDTM